MKFYNWTLMELQLFMYNIRHFCHKCFFNTFGIVFNHGMYLKTRRRPFFLKFEIWHYPPKYSTTWKKVMYTEFVLGENLKNYLMSLQHFVHMMKKGWAMALMIFFNLFGNIMLLYLVVVQDFFPNVFGLMQWCSIKNGIKQYWWYFVYKITGNWSVKDSMCQHGDSMKHYKPYHGALKIWLILNTHGLWGRKVDWLMWWLTNLVAIHYMYMQYKKINGLVLNKVVNNVVQMSLTWAWTIMVKHTLPPSTSRGIWMVKSQCANDLWYMVNQPLAKYFFACVSGWYMWIFTNINV